MSKILIGIVVVVLIIAAIAVSVIIVPELAITEEKVDGCTFLRPEFGRIECEPISAKPVENVVDMDLGKGSFTLKCGDDENTPGPCKYYIRCVSGACWTKVSSSTSTKHYGPFGDSGELSKDYRTEVMSVNLGQTITFEDIQPLLNSKIKVWEASIRYGLNVYDSGGKWRYNIESCDLGDLSWVEKSRVCIRTDGKACKEIKKTDRLPFDTWVNYLSDWTPVPLDISRKIVIWQGSQAYCQVNQIYNLGEFETEAGCYKYPNSIIASVDCCPGMETANSRCSDNFKWEPIETWECQTNADCDEGYKCQNNKCILIIECVSSLECPGIGQDICTQVGNEYIVTKYGCINNKCIVGADVKVDCCPPFSGCDEGYVCDPSKGYKCIKQTGPDIVCGDGVCSKPFENVVNCPEDCEVEPFEIPWNYVLPIIIIVIGTLLTYVLTKNWIWTAIGFLVSSVIGLILWWFLSLTWWARILLTLGIAGSIVGIVYILIVTGILGFMVMVILVLRRK